MLGQIKPITRQMIYTLTPAIHGRSLSDSSVNLPAGFCLAPFFIAALAAFCSAVRSEIDIIEPPFYGFVLNDKVQSDITGA